MSAKIAIEDVFEVINRAVRDAKIHSAIEKKWGLNIPEAMDHDDLVTLHRLLVANAVPIDTNNPYQE